MATPATLNSWLDQLSASIIKESEVHKKGNKRVQDAFRRRARKQNYARTNQFEVEARFDGLEEKFQILTLDNLSDALRQRMLELKDFGHLWLPDVLDLLLHLAGNPARNGKLLELYRVPERVGTPPALRWKDLLVDSPVDRRDRLWRIPDFRDTDDSGYDDDLNLSTTSTKASPQQAIDDRRKEPIDEGRLLQVVENDPVNPAINVLEGRKQPDHISEERFIRETLFLLRGYPSAIYTQHSDRHELGANLKVHGIPLNTMRFLVGCLSLYRQNLDIVLAWLNESSGEEYITAIKHATEGFVRQYYKTLDVLQASFVDPSGQRVVSVAQMLEEVESSSISIGAISEVLRRTRGRDPVVVLEELYSEVDTSQLCNDDAAYDCLRSLLASGLRKYMEPIQIWVTTGRLPDEQASFFIRSRSGKSKLPSLWHGTFVLDGAGKNRPAAFLTCTAQQVFACGKTSAFVSHLGFDHILADAKDTLNTNDLVYGCGGDMALPSTAAFEHRWQEHVKDLLQSRTSQLKQLLDTRCNFSQSLHTIGQIYLRQDAAFLNDMDLKLFDRIDRCMDSWNDRFQLRDILEEAFQEQHAVHVPSMLTINSVYTPSRSMQSKRTSINILKSLSFEYELPWPLANIIEAEAMTAYRRIALVLVQIRRAKYAVERIGFLSAMTVPLGEDAGPAEQRFAQILAFTLLSFINTLYDHIMTTTINSATTTMHVSMQTATTVDEMINIHRTYILRLEYSSLAAPKVKVLRQSLAALLDLCIRFSDLVSNPTKAQQADLDDEAGSFRSARSRDKRLRPNQYDQDSEDDEHEQPDGFSSFIVLEDDTTVAKELRKVYSQFQKHLNFLIAGLRGVGRAGQHVQDLEVLAERLCWSRVK